MYIGAFFGGEKFLVLKGQPWAGFGGRTHFERGPTKSNLFFLKNFKKTLEPQGETDGLKGVFLS